MANTSLNVVITDANTNEARNQTLPDLNPAASNAQLKAFAQAFYGLSDDTYVDAVRIDKKDVDTEDTDTSSGKLSRTVTANNLVKGESTDITITKGSDETLSPVFLYDNNGTATAWSVTKVMGTTDTGSVKYRGNIPSTATALYVGVVGTDDYYPQFTQLTTQ